MITETSREFVIWILFIKYGYVGNDARKCYVQKSEEKELCEDVMYVCDMLKRKRIDTIPTAVPHSSCFLKAESNSVALV